MNAICFEAHVLGERIITPEVMLGAGKRVGEGGAGPARELEEHVLCGRFPLFNVVQTEPDVRLLIVHRAFQEYFVACAIRDAGWTLPVVPWHLEAWWAGVVRLGGHMGAPFWRGLLRGTPEP